MKIFELIKKNKYPIMVTLFFIAVIACIVMFIQGLKKDSSLEIYTQKMELQEAARQSIIKERTAWQQVVLQQNKTLLTLQIRDSVMAANSNLIQTKILTISQPKYVKEKIAPIDNYSDNDLLQYFNDLPDTKEPNDY